MTPIKIFNFTSFIRLFQVFPKKVQLNQQSAQSVIDYIVQVVHTNTPARLERLPDRQFEAAKDVMDTVLAAMAKEQSDHFEMRQCCLNRRFLFRRALRLFGIL